VRESCFGSRRIVMIGMLRRVRAKVPNVALGVIVGLIAGGGAFAIAQTTGDDGGVHGGPKPRFHDARECNLTDVSKLPGNWTHGDYVSAVAKQDPSKVRDAAHSRCGKPSHAGRGGAKQKDSKDTKQPATKPSKTPKASPSPKSTSTSSRSPTPTVSPTPTAGATATPTPTGSSPP
jgi:hypothetical protein